MTIAVLRQRSWRRARRRGVSDIVATILLVAIGVVLAAVLYVLVVGISHGPGSTPIGSAFLASHPATGTCIGGSEQTLGAAAITGGCNPGDFIYTLTVESSSVHFGDVLLELKTSSGKVYAGGSASASFALLDPGSHVASISLTGVPIAMVSTWQGYGLTIAAPTYTVSTPLTDLFTIVIDTGSASATTGQGLTFIVLGTGSFSGTTTPVSLP